MPEQGQELEWVYFPANQEELEKALEKICSHLANREEEADLYSKIRLVLEEIMLNIVNHAYKHHHTGPVHVGWKINNDGSRTIKFVDSGEGFNPLKNDPPDTEAGLEDRPIGGLGIHLVRQMTRDIQYKRQGNENILTVKI